MAEVSKKSAQSSGAARKFSPGPPETNRPGRSAPAPPDKPAGTETSDPNELKSEYERTGRQLKRWLWAGVILLLLGFGLWRWGPRERLAETVPVAVRGYTFKQAGAVRGPGGATWLWILADTADQAQVLLSPDHGRTWRARALGVPGYRARALALGWGAPGKGLLVGDSGWVRTLDNVFQTPTRGQNRQLADVSAALLHSVAVDTIGQEAVVTAANGRVWTTISRGQTWTPERLSATRLIEPDSGIIAAYWPRRGSFLLVSAQRIGELQPASKAVEVDMKSWLGLTPAKPGNPMVALTFDYNPELEQDHLLFTTGQGQALYAWRIEGAGPAATSYASLRLFGTGGPAVALAFWPLVRPDSALLLAHSPTGDQLRRIVIRPQLAIAEAEARSKLSSVVAEPPVSQVQQAGTAPPAARPAASPTAPTRLATGGRTAANSQPPSTEKGSGRGQADTRRNEVQTNSAASEDPKNQVSAKPAADKNSIPLNVPDNTGNQIAPIYQQTRPRPDSLNPQRQQPTLNQKRN